MPVPVARAHPFDLIEGNPSRRWSLVSAFALTVAGVGKCPLGTNSTADGRPGRHLALQVIILWPLSHLAYRLLFHTLAPLYGEQMKKIVTVVAFAAALALTGCSSTTTDSPSAGATSGPAAVASKAADAPTKPKVAEVPTEYKSALKSAENYNKIIPMSKAGLFAQLTSEAGDKFSEKAAQYAVDNIKADWNANALKSAKNYQEMMAMSPEAIREQLVSDAGDKYTAEEADYAVKNLG